ncbi:hypothetical protein [Dyadobacter sp. CY347]|uniref:hypothetical protein n=1 Tax=Dyadobacter sp. CY347 TaxID=2909336 RepID=UPI001F46424E|nr:hypothetical protein [Dyadobacter sp. CY347]MCF2488043.1 hypothetical protein [Dyadobacter sp. CY347]
MQRADMIVAEQNHQAKQANEQSQALQLNKGEKKELAQLPETRSKQEQEKKRGFGFGV